MSYIIGIDGGTQSTKVSIFDLSGNSLYEEKVELSPLHMPTADIAEHPGDDLWDSLVLACNRVMKKFPYDKSKILGIGLGSIRCCRVYLDFKGELAHPVINWMDKRLAHPYQKDISNMEYLTTTTGYLTVKLTGNFVDTSANYEGIYGPFNKETWDWSNCAEDYIHYNIKKENLFSLVKPGSLLGTVTKEASERTSLPINCPVFATANDKAVECLGSGIDTDSACLISLGTYIGGMTLGTEYKDNSVSYWSNLSAVPSKYLNETSTGIRRGMWGVSWFKELLGEPFELIAKERNKSVEDLLEEEAKNVPPGSEGLVTVGEFLSPNDMPWRKASFIGFDGRHKRAHVYRSILESIAMTMKIHVTDMYKEMDVALEKVVITGGGSNSELFMQIFSDVFGVSSVRNEVNNAASLGAAMNATVGLGIYQTYEEAKHNMVKIKDSFEPNLVNTEVYNKIINDYYRNIRDYTDPVNKKIYDNFG